MLSLLTSRVLPNVGLADPGIAGAKYGCLLRFTLAITSPPASKFLSLQKPVTHVLNPACSNVVVSYVGLERRQPSQNFGPIISDCNVMAIMHVGTDEAMGKRGRIVIFGVGSIN